MSFIKDYPYIVVTHYETFEDEIEHAKTLVEALEIAGKDGVVYKLVEAK
jgi:hypothetical protein